MPPPVPSESESELSSDSSGSESVHTIENNPPGGPYFMALPPAQEPSDSSSDEIDSDAGWAVAAKAPGESFFRVALPRLKPTAKRKADFPDTNDGRAVKVSRGGLTDGQFVKIEDDDDSSGPGGCVAQSLSVGEGPISAGADSAPVSSHPPYPQTTLELFKQTYPHLTARLARRTGRLFKYLAGLPVKRIPVVTDNFSDAKSQNVVAYLMQAAGDVVPMAEACGKCSRQTGVFRNACVVLRDPDVADLTGGSCAACWYSRQGSLCTFRQDNAPTGEAPFVAFSGTTASQRPAPAPAPAPVPVPVPVPVPAPAPAPAPDPDLENRLNPLVMTAGPGPTASVPLHPSYAAAALAAERAPVAPTPAVVPEPRPASPRDPSSPRERVRAWEERYGRMSTQDLLQVHAQLIRWQEDLSTRLIAINRLALRRLTEHGGPSRSSGGARNGSEETQSR
ncbi:hypothetical protein VTH06DRAFT_4015 [Thermothelomyces fergusii]